MLQALRVSLQVLGDFIRYYGFSSVSSFLLGCLSTYSIYFASVPVYSVTDWETFPVCLWGLNSVPLSNPQVVHGSCGALAGWWSAVKLISPHPGFQWFMPNCSSFVSNLQFNPPATFPLVMYSLHEWNPYFKIIYWDKGKQNYARFQLSRVKLLFVMFSSLWNYSGIVSNNKTMLNIPGSNCTLFQQSPDKNTRQGAHVHLWLITVTVRLWGGKKRHDSEWN